MLFDVKQIVEKHREMQKSTTDFNKADSKKDEDSPYLSPAGKRREKLKNQRRFESTFELSFGTQMRN